jgi:FkbM family methyltransferase
MGASSWLRSWVERLRPGVIVELGAHLGEDTTWMAEIPGCTVHAIEADPRNVPPAKLLARSNVRWASAAVSDREGEADLWGSERANDRPYPYTESSSLRRPKEHLAIWPDVTFAGKPMRVRTVMLDSFAQDIGSVDLIWADVQGAEDLMILGGRQTLARTSWLVVETSDREVYEGQPTKDKLLALLGDDWRLVTSEQGNAAPMIVVVNEKLVPDWKERFVDIQPIQIADRMQLGSVLNDLGLLGTGAEIGCAYGAYAEHVLSQWRGSQYLMVDLWAPQPTDVYREDQSGLRFDECLRKCTELAAREPRIKMMRMDSVAAAAQIEDGSLDWVYIDGNHDYGPVLADMDAWWPKVKPGGVFSGHDFYNAVDAPGKGHYCRVQDAVERWMREHALFCHVTSCTSWWSRKPR